MAAPALLAPKLSLEWLDTVNVQGAWSLEHFLVINFVCLLVIEGTWNLEHFFFLLVLEAWSTDF